LRELEDRVLVVDLVRDVLVLGVEVVLQGGERLLPLHRVTGPGCGR
jgi:hypothetical protein